MPDRHFKSSLTRIADLDNEPYTLVDVDRAAWERGDYVAGEVTGLHGHRQVELASGREIELAQGDVLIGALGDRFATLEATGSWRDIDTTRTFHALTAGGIFGRCRTRSDFIPEMMELTYRGHVARNETKLTMQEFASAPDSRTYRRPTVLIMGTSMSAGKTTASRIIIRQLCRNGVRVAGAKLTGAGRYRDILSMSDAGARWIMDFVDVGLPSTVMEDNEFRPHLARLLSLIEQTECDVAVVEIGASPLEPYGGVAALGGLRDQVRFTVLCATDPYGVSGVSQAFNRKADLVTGIAANTEAGIQLVERISGIPTLNLRGKAALPRLRKMLFPALGLT